MSLSRSAVILSAISSSFAYTLNGNPTLAPIRGRYHQETLWGQLQIEQSTYTPYNLFTKAVENCINQIFVDKLPGVQPGDIWFNETAFTSNREAWAYVTTYYLPFSITFIPEAVSIAQNLPAIDTTYPGPEDKVLLIYKDILAKFIASTEFVATLQRSSECQTQSQYINYVYLSYGRTDHTMLGSDTPRRRRNWGLKYVWILFGLLIPITIVYYLVYTEYGTKPFFAPTKYDLAKEAELTTAAGEAPVEDA